MEVLAQLRSRGKISVGDLGDKSPEAGDIPQEYYN